MTSRAKQSKTATRRAKRRPPRTCIHAICRDCYRTKPNIREPLKLHVPHCISDFCCYCGKPTKAGFYYRDKRRLPAVYHYGAPHLPLRRCDCATARRKHPRYPPGYRGQIAGYYDLQTKKWQPWVKLQPDGHLT